MRLVIQRVKEAQLWINEKLYSQINKGILALVAIGSEDNEEDILYSVDKMVQLRIFPDEKGVMNLSLLEVQGDLLIVSQFTLYGDCRKGRRPSYSNSLKPELAETLYEQFVQKSKEYNLNVKTGEFRANMDIKLVNWGPVTLLLDSKKLF